MPSLTLKKSNWYLGALLVLLLLSSGLFIVSNQLNAPREIRSITSQDIIDAFSGINNPFLIKESNLDALNSTNMPHFINPWSDEYYSSQEDEHNMVNKLHEDMDSYLRVVSIKDARQTILQL